MVERRETRTPILLRFPTGRRLVGIIALTALILGSVSVIVTACIHVVIAATRMGRPVVLSPALQLRERDGSCMLCNSNGLLILPAQVVGGVDAGVTHLGRVEDSIVVRAEWSGGESGGTWAIYYLDGGRRWTGNSREFEQRKARDPMLANLRMETAQDIMWQPSLVGAKY